MFKNDKYITKGISSKLPKETILLIWSLIDIAREKISLDYLQVFELSILIENDVKFQKIVHFQERPKYKKVFCIPCNEPINEKIYCIDDKTHSTMLFSYEY